ncbi:MAG: PAS domain-containing protein [Undibacterium sp.]|uniref:PAS domain-containing protein n=1 Tax=Undibacterium sp. TaxID=1914977 RepID=UPI002728900E|nr:PAS domain-containing protein [Undibacterium sp.]MDO8651043.1 PAS domain-containing protein [Undibacterium sp.]
MSNNPHEVLIASDDASSFMAKPGTTHRGDGDVRLLLDAIGEGLWDWNLLTGEIIFSPGYQRLLGYSGDQFGHHLDEWIKRVHPDDAEHAMQVMQSCADATTSRFEDEHRLLCSDGNWKWVRSRGAVVERGTDGRPARLLGVITAITQDRAPSAQLTKNHALLANFSQHLRNVFFYQFQAFPDGTSCFPYASEAIIALYGVDPEQVKTDASVIFNLIHPDDLERLRSAIRLSAATLQTWHQEYRIKTAAGERWLTGDAHPELLADGSVLWHGFLIDISERKRIEQKLSSADQQMQLILKASNQGVFDFNVQTGEGNFSAEYARMLGLAPEDFLDAKKFWNFFWNESIHPDDVAGLKQAYQAHFTSGGATEYKAEFRQRTTSGEWRWIMSLGRVVEWDQQGRALRMVGTHTDISGLKRAEQAARHHEELLSASKERYKQLANELDILVSNAPVGIMFVSDGNIVRANKTLAELCNFSDAKAMIGIKSTFLYQDEADYRAFTALVIPKLLADESVELEWLVKRIDGSSFMARIAGRALPSEQYVRGAVWMMEDITAQRHTLDALKQSEQRLQRLMNSNLVGIAQGVEDARLNDVNKVFVQLCGYPRAALIGNENVWDLLLSPQDLETFKLAYAELLDTGSTAAFEMQLKHHDGHTVPVLVGLSYLENSHSEWVIFMMDISERHRINQLKSEFISVVSHELRTPLTSIRGSLSLLEAGVGGELPEKAQHLIKIAHNNSRRLVGLVNDILDMEKLASGKMSFKTERVDLVHLLEQAIEANVAYALALNVSLRLVHHPERAWVVAAPDRLMQVLANLLSNAAKFSPKGETVRLEIRPYLERGKAHYKVEVTDLGLGIPASFQTRIFEPFTQADGTDTRQQGGTGLGLSISKTLIEKMHGQLGFVTAEGQGTTFWFTFEAAE